MDLINVLDYCTNLIHGVSGGGIPDAVGNLIHLAFVLIQVVVPILLIIWGMLDFAKSVVAKKEDDIKKYQKNFISRLISALIVFLIVVIVQFAVSVMNSVEQKSNVEGQTISDAWGCTKKFINGVESEPVSDIDQNSQSNN